MIAVYKYLVIIKAMLKINSFMNVNIYNDNFV